MPRMLGSTAMRSRSVSRGYVTCNHPVHAVKGSVYCHETSAKYIVCRCAFVCACVSSLDLICTMWYVAA